MQSICPNCKKQIEHEDFLFEVHCECGSRFNPFMNLSETPPLDGVEAAPAATPDFQESQSVFAELKMFAEGEISDSPVSASSSLGEMALEGSDAPPPKPTARVPRPAMEGSASETILTSGDGLPGYRIDAYLPPVSATCELNPSDANPMGSGFDALWARALEGGANGVVAVRWVLSPDGTRVVLSGTPVRCTKDGH